jgi:hypothetical protein
MAAGGHRGARWLVGFVGAQHRQLLTSDIRFSVSHVPRPIRDEALHRLQWLRALRIGLWEVSDLVALLEASERGLGMAARIALHNWAAHSIAS